MSEVFEIIAWFAAILNISAAYVEIYTGSKIMALLNGTVGFHILWVLIA